MAILDYTAMKRKLTDLRGTHSVIAHPQAPNVRTVSAASGPKCSTFTLVADGLSWKTTRRLRRMLQSNGTAERR